MTNSLRRPAKLPHMIVVCIAILGIYIYLIIKIFLESELFSTGIFLPLVLGGIAGIASLPFLSKREDLGGGADFKDHGFRPAAVHGARWNEEMVVLFRGPFVRVRRR